MKHLTSFNNHTDYQDYIDSSTTILSNVSYCKNENHTHFKAFDGIICTFNVTNISSPVTLISNPNNCDYMFIDEEKVNPVNSYTFSKPGIHVVKYKLKSNLTYIDSSFFAGNSAIKSVRIQASNITELSYNCFTSCTNLEYVYIKSKITAIYNLAFIQCINLKEIHFPNTLQYIWSEAFRNCTSLTELNLPNSLISINQSSFRNCGIKHLIIPDSVTTINQYAFKDCSNLETVKLGKGITALTSDIFETCPKFKSITFSDKLTLIDQNAFYDCPGLQSLTITKNIIRLGFGSDNTGADLIGYNCTSLTHLIVQSDVFTTTDDSLSSIFVGAPLTHIILEEGITTIGYNLFNNKNNIVLLSLPDSITTIKPYAFYSCSFTTLQTIGLKGSGSTLEFTNNLTSIGVYAFSNCQSLTKVVLPDTITSISHDTFYSCLNLTEVTLGRNLTSIGDYAFRYCNNLVTITLLSATPPSVGSSSFTVSGGSIENRVFYVPEESIELYRNNYSFVHNACNGDSQMIQPIPAYNNQN